MVEVTRVNGRLVQAPTPQTLQQRLQAQRTELRRKQEQVTPKKVQPQPELTALQKKYGVERGKQIEEANRKRDEAEAELERLRNLGSKFKQGTPQYKQFVKQFNEAKLQVRLTRDRSKQLRGKLTRKQQQKVIEERKRLEKARESFKAPKGKRVVDSIRVGGVIVTGTTDDKGVFSPDKSSVKDFQVLKKTFGTNKKSDIEAIKKIPSVAKQLKNIKKNIRASEIAQTKNQIIIAKQNQAYVNKKKAFLIKQDNIVKNNSNILTKTNKVIEDFKKKRPVVVNFQDDPEFATDLFRLNVNQASRELGLKVLPINARLSDFEKKANEINKRVNEINNKVDQLIPTKNEDLNKLLSPTEQEALLKKEETGQSLTPMDMSNLAAIKLSNGQKLSKAQYSNFRTLIKSPFDAFGASALYVANLVNRKRAGEKTPLANDFKKGLDFAGNVGIELGKITKELFNVSVKGVALGLTGVQKATENILAYEQKLIREATKGGDVKKILGDDLRKIASPVKTTFEKTGDALKTFRKHPKETLLLIAGASVAGALTGVGLIGLGTTKGGKLLLSAIKKNPERAIAEAIFWLFPTSKAIKGLEKVTKPVDKLLDVNKLNVDKFTSVTKFETSRKTGVVSPVTKIKGSVRSKTLFGNDIFSTYKLKYNARTKELTGIIVHNSKGVKTEERIKYLDEGPFFTDLKTKKKIPKRILPIKSRSIKVETTKTMPIKESILISGGNQAIKRRTTIEKTTLSIVNGISKETERLSDVIKATPKNIKEKIVALSQQISKNLKKKKAVKFKPLTKSELNFIENYLKNFIQYDKELYFGIDRRTRLAKALGVSKGSPVIKTLEAIVDKNGNILGKIERQLTIKEVGEVITKKKLIPDIKINIRFGRSIPLRKSKSGNLYISTPKIKYDILKKGKKTTKTISLPKFSAPLPSSKIKLKGLGLFKTTRSLQKDFKILYKQLQMKEQINLKKIDELQSRIIDNIKKINRKFDNLRKTKQIKVTQLKKITPMKKVTRLKKVSPKKVIKPIPKIRPRPPSKPPRKPIRLPDFDSSAYNNKVIIVNGIYRERKNRSLPASKRNPVITKTLRLQTTRNRALKKIGELADRRTVRSITTKIVGVTNKKLQDIKRPDVLKKFDKKKSKNTPVLKLVEKSKFISDTRGEKKELSKARRRIKRSPIKKQKKIKKTKTIKKKKSKK